MLDADKTKEQLIEELKQVRRRISELEAAAERAERAEEALRESEEFSTSLLKNAPNPILVTNPDRSIKYINPAFEELAGFTMEQVAGSGPPFPWWLPQDQDKNLSALLEAEDMKLLRDERHLKN